MIFHTGLEIFLIFFFLIYLFIIFLLAHLFKFFSHFKKIINSLHKFSQKYSLLDHTSWWLMLRQHILFLHPNYFNNSFLTHLIDKFSIPDFMKLELGCCVHFNTRVNACCACRWVRINSKSKAY